MGGVKYLPSIQAIVPHRSGTILRSIVTLLKSHVLGSLVTKLMSSCRLIVHALVTRTHTRAPIYVLVPVLMTQYSYSVLPYS